MLWGDCEWMLMAFCWAPESFSQSHKNIFWNIVSPRNQRDERVYQFIFLISKWGIRFCAYHIQWLIFMHILWHFSDCWSVCMSELDKAPWRSLHSLNMCVWMCVCWREREKTKERESMTNLTWIHHGVTVANLWLPPSLSLYLHLSGLLSSSSLCFLAGSGENLDHTSCFRITAGFGSVWCHQRSRGAQVRPLLFY